MQQLIIDSFKARLVIGQMIFDIFLDGFGVCLFDHVENVFCHV